MNRTELSHCINDLINYLIWAHQQQQSGHFVDPVRLRDTGYVLGGLLNQWLALSEDDTFTE